MKKGLIIFDLDKTLFYKGVNIKQIKQTLIKLRINYDLVLLSNAKSKNVLRELDEINLQDYFDGIYSRLFFINRKPLPFRYRAILKMYPYSRNCVYCVGDKLITDILGANLMHFNSVWFNPNNKKKFLSRIIKPKYTINDINELLTIL